MHQSVSERLESALGDWRRGDPERSVSSFQRSLKDARITGSSYAMVHRYLRGTHQPSLEFLEAAADLLGVRGQWLVHGDEPRTQAEAELLVERPTSFGVLRFPATDTQASIHGLANELGLAELSAACSRLVASCRDGNEATPEQIEQLADWLGKQIVAPISRIAGPLPERQGQDYVRAACLALMLLIPERQAGGTVADLIERLEN